jgi:Tat protein secretion system quality control protein TatD with DNase activity
MSHQVAVVEAQLELALKRKRNVSFHCVQAQGPTMELLHRFAKKHGPAWQDINVDMHSFGGSTDVIQDLQRRYGNLYFSFSTTINSRSPRLKDNIRAVRDERLLVESDWNSLDGHLDRLSEIVNIVADAKGWDLETTWARESPSCGSDEGLASHSLKATGRAFLDRSSCARDDYGSLLWM